MDFLLIVGTGKASTSSTPVDYWHQVLTSVGRKAQVWFGKEETNHFFFTDIIACVGSASKSTETK